MNSTRSKTFMRTASGLILLVAQFLPLGVNHSFAASAGSEAEPPPSEVTSGYLEAKPGFTGSYLGVEIGKVIDSSEQQSQIIELNVPVDPLQVDRVEVLTPAGEIMPQTRKAVIVPNYENNSVDIQLHLPNQKQLGFRLKLIGEAGSFAD